MNYACPANIGKLESPEKASSSPRDSKKKKVLRNPSKAVKEFVDYRDNNSDKLSKSREEKNTLEDEQQAEQGSRSLSPKGFHYAGKYKALNQVPSPSSSRLVVASRVSLPPITRNSTFQRPFHSLSKPLVTEEGFPKKKAAGDQVPTDPMIFARDNVHKRNIFSDQFNSYSANVRDHLKRNYAHISRSEQPSNSQREEEEAIIMSLKKVRISSKFVWRVIDSNTWQSRYEEKIYWSRRQGSATETSPCIWYFSEATFCWLLVTTLWITIQLSSSLGTKLKIHWAGCQG